MLNNYFTQLNNISMTKRAAVVNRLRMYKYAQNAPDFEAEPIPMPDFETGLRGRAQAAGKDYAPAVGYGAAGGALAGIPIALLANAVFGKDKGLRGSLRAALMGGLLGGGAGALGGGAGKYLYDNVPESREYMDKGIAGAKSTAQSIANAMGMRPGEMTTNISAESGPLIPTPIRDR